MGSRLGVIVKTIDGWDIRYDHWSAQTLGRDIALDGYEATLTRIRQMAPYGVDTPQEMKSAPWLEGTLFIDMTTKRIVWAEESEGCYLPRLINALIELTWPGWTAIWSPEGTRGTLRATGADTDIIYTDHSFKDLGDFDAASDMAPWTISNETDAFSCTTENNKTITWGNYIDLENIALLGPNKMHTLVNKVIQGCNEGKPWQWNLQTHNKQPEKGIHIDYINETIKWWIRRNKGLPEDDTSKIDLTEIISLTPDDKTRGKCHIEFQTAENGLCGHSLEEAIRNVNRKHYDLGDSISEEDLEFKGKSKTDFALDLIYKCTDYCVPAYIKSGLTWLNNQRVLE